MCTTFYATQLRMQLIHFMLVFNSNTQFKLTVAGYLKCDAEHYYIHYGFSQPSEN